MASVDQSSSINGHYNGQPYADQTFSAANSTSGYTSTAASQQTAQGDGNTQEIPKDEVGWYFVEQYYTTLSKNPEKLFLFYNKKSQFVSGTEAEKVMTCVGQKAINERIKELDIQDCKVRVTNVDSQGSGPNIVIQVIGEISSKGQPQKKFVQTFVLAEQTNGYFVLNDIFRYIDEDGDDTQDDEHTLINTEITAQSVKPTTEDAPPIDEKAGEQETDNLISEEGDEGLIHTSGNVNGQPAATYDAAPTERATEPSLPSEAEETGASDAVADAVSEQVVAEDIAQPEKPKDPEPTPVASPPKQAAQPAKPAAPKTWAGLVAANRVALPTQASTAQAAGTAAAAPKSKASAPTAPTATTAAPAAAAAPTPATAPAASTGPVSAGADAEQPSTPGSTGSEWQTAQRDGHNRKQSRAQPSIASADNSRGYIKNVGSNVSEEALKSKLDSVGKVVYFDINRQKNCAFVDFADAGAYQAAVAASPLEVDGERFYVEERRVKASSGGFPGGVSNGGRGGGFNRTRGDRPGAQGRGGFSREGTRGGFNPRGGRGGGAARGRGGAPAAS